MDSDRRNMLFMIFAIIAVCVVALVAVFSVMWRISGGVITRTLQSFNRYASIQSLNYNFPVPEATEITPEESNDNQEESEVPETPEVTFPTYNFNFQTPFYETDRATFRIEDLILEDAKILGLGTGNELTTIPYQIQIPKISLSSIVSQGKGESDLLQKGFWLHPESNNLLTGEAIFLCHRQFFSPNDHRSCWFLDKLENGDKIFITNLESKIFEYEITKAEVIEADAAALDQIYAINPTGVTLKIVSTAPLNQNDKRIVITAKLINPEPEEE